MLPQVDKYLLKLLNDLALQSGGVQPFGGHVVRVDCRMDLRDTIDRTVEETFQGRQRRDVQLLQAGDPFRLTSLLRVGVDTAAAYRLQLPLEIVQNGFWGVDE